MLTLLVILAVAAVLFVAAYLATSGQDVLAEAPPDGPDLGLPEGRMTPHDVEHIRFGLAFRGYRMSEVDDALDRLSFELAERDERIAELQAALAEAIEPAVAQAEAELARAKQGPAPATYGGTAAEEEDQPPAGVQVPHPGAAAQQPQTPRPWPVEPDVETTVEPAVDELVPAEEQPWAQQSTPVRQTTAPAGPSVTGQSPGPDREGPGMPDEPPELRATPAGAPAAPVPAEPGDPQVHAAPSDAPEISPAAPAVAEPMPSEPLQGEPVPAEGFRSGVPAAAPTAPDDRSAETTGTEAPVAEPTPSGAEHTSGAEPTPSGAERRVQPEPAAPEPEVREQSGSTSRPTAVPADEHRADDPGFPEVEPAEPVHPPEPARRTEDEERS